MFIIRIKHWKTVKCVNNRKSATILACNFPINIKTADRIQDKYQGKYVYKEKLQRYIDVTKSMEMCPAHKTRAA